MSLRSSNRSAIALLMLAFGACGAPDAHETDVERDDQVVSPELISAFFSGEKAHVDLASPLDAATFDLTSVRLSTQLVKPDGSVEELSFASGATPSADGKTLEIALDDMPVLGRIYDVMVERLDGEAATKLGEIWSEDPAELRESELAESRLRALPRGGAILKPDLIGSDLIIDPSIFHRSTRNNTDNFVAKRTDPATTTSRPGLLYRRDHVDAGGEMIAAQQETRAITVFFGNRNEPEGADHVEPAERIDCSWIPSGTPEGSPETNRNVFRISTRRPGSSKGQFMYMDRNTVEGDYFYRGEVTCDPFENSLTFHLPGRLLGAADVTLYAVAKSVGGYYAEREYRFRVENPDVRVDLTKLRQEHTICADFGWDLGCQGRRLPNTYIPSAMAVNTGRIVEDAERGVFAAQIGPWENLPGGAERFPTNTRLYSGPMGVGAELALPTMSDNDSSTEALLSQIWKVSSQIFCATFSYCPAAVIPVAGEAHDMITAEILRAGDDRVLGGKTLWLGRHDDPAAAPEIGVNWGLDHRAGTTWDYRYGYRVLIPGGSAHGAAGNVSVWLKFNEAQPSWENPTILI
jgi:hypothetical protein